MSANTLPWDSERGEQIWLMKPIAERQQRLEQLDKMLFAAMNIRLNSNGLIEKKQSWKEIKRD